MKSLYLCLLALSASLVLPKASKKLSASGDLQPITHIKQETPKVSIYGSSYTTTNNGWGFSYSVGADLIAGYEMPMAYLYVNNRDNIYVNPFAFVEIASLNYIELLTPLIQPRLMVEAIGVKFQGADFQFLWNLDNKSEYCFSFSWLLDIINVYLKFSVNVYECDWGVFGYLYMNNVGALCRWRRYEPINPVITLNDILREYDIAEDWIPYNCY